MMKFISGENNEVCAQKLIKLMTEISGLGPDKRAKY